MLEVHITGWAATADDSSTLTVAQVEASETEELPTSSRSSLPMVELYTQFGSQVSEDDQPVPVCQFEIFLVIWIVLCY